MGKCLATQACHRAGVIDAPRVAGAGCDALRRAGETARPGNTERMANAYIMFGRGESGWTLGTYTAGDRVRTHSGSRDAIDWTGMQAIAESFRRTAESVE
jgi:hypothetical protein